MSKPKILYFIRGTTPTAEDRKNAEALGTKAFRNATVGINQLESCEAVAGFVPSQYIKAGIKILKPETKPADPAPVTGKEPEAKKDETANTSSPGFVSPWQKS